MEEAEGLLARKMEMRRPGRGGSEEEVAQTRAGAGGPSNEPINVPPSKEPINAPPSNEPINASPSNEQQEEDEEVSIQEEEARVVLNEQDFFNQHNDYCEVCNQPGVVLCCAMCNLFFHVNCARPKLQDEPPGDWMCAYCCVECVGGKKDGKERRKATQACREMERMKRECVKEHANEDEGSSEGGVPCAAPSDDHFVLDMNDDDNNEDNDNYDGHKDNEENKDDEDHEDDKDDEDKEDDEDEEDEEDEEDDKNDEDEEDDEDDDDVGTFSNKVEGGVPGAPHSTLIKQLHILNQTPTYRRSVIEKDEIDLLIKKLHQMKTRGEIGGKPCDLGTSWTYKKEAIVKHRIGRMVGWRNSFKVLPGIICTGNAPSLTEVINGIKRTKDTKIGKDVSIIEVPVDVLEHCSFVPFAQNAKAFITSRFELLYGLKNKNGELEMYYMGEKTSKGEVRKKAEILKSMFVNGESKQTLIGRFGLMCFSANRDKSDWDRCKCDHMNGDPTDDRKENVRWLTPADNKNNYHNKRARRSHAARV